MKLFMAKLTLHDICIKPVAFDILYGVKYISNKQITIRL